MALNLLEFADLATVYVFILAVRLHYGSLKVGTYQGRGKVLYQTTLGAEISFALKEGQTIVAVGDTTTAMCFYIGSDVMEKKNPHSTEFSGGEVQAHTDSLRK